MEPVTHILTGAVLGRSGLNRRAAYTTAAMAIAAEFPDIDTLWGLRGPVSSFVHHRGITHTFLGIPFEAALITGGFWLYHRVRRARTDSKVASRPPSAAPLRWGALYGFVVLALLSHILLDWTNNYGVRPFLPFDGHWHAGSIVFIFDPPLFIILVLALVLPELFRLIASEVGTRRKPLAHPGWARFAVVAIVAYWSVRGWEHHRAVALASSIPYRDAPTEEPTRFGVARAVLASPDPLSIFRWHIASDTGDTVHLSLADVRHGSLGPDGPPLHRAAPSASLDAAEETPLGRAYLDWSPLPVLNVLPPAYGPDTSRPGPNAATEVLLRDPRFMGEFPVMGRRNPPPLTGTVVLDAQNRVLEQRMDGKAQR
jgi:inner membrane protein